MYEGLHHIRHAFASLCIKIVKQAKRARHFKRNAFVIKAHTQWTDTWGGVAKVEWRKERHHNISFAFHNGDFEVYCSTVWPTVWKSCTPLLRSLLTGDWAALKSSRHQHQELLRRENEGGFPTHFDNVVNSMFFNSTVQCSLQKVHSHVSVQKNHLL